AVALFDSFPKDELFSAPVDDLRRVVVSLLALEGTDRIRLLGRRAPDKRSASFVLALPRDRYEPALVEKVRGLFRRRFETEEVEAQHVLDEGQRARVHFLVHRRDGLPEHDNRELEQEVLALTRTWDDQMREVLGDAGAVLADTWLPHLPEHYK